MTYTPITDPRHMSTPIVVCDGCGAMVVDTDAHDRFHSEPA